MREIKYRFWMTKLNEYFSWERIMRHCPEQLYDYLSETRESVLVREQYTGMKDKNGIEIYVGDIVKYTHDWEVYAVENEIAVVEFEEGGFSPMQLANGGTYYALESKPTYEVIGNIHDREEKLNV